MKLYLVGALIALSVLGCKKDDPKPTTPVNPFTESLQLVKGKYIVDNDTWPYRDFGVIETSFFAAEPSYKQIGYDEYVLHVSNNDKFTDTVQVMTIYINISHKAARETILRNTKAIPSTYKRKEPFYWRIVYMDKMLSTPPMKFYIK